MDSPHTETHHTETLTTQPHSAASLGPTPLAENVASSSPATDQPSTGPQEAPPPAAASPSQTAGGAMMQHSLPQDYPPHDAAHSDLIDAHLVSEGLAAIIGPAVAALLKTRYDQIVGRGHDADSDDMHPIGWLAGRAKADAMIAIDRIANRSDDNHDFTAAKTALSRCASYALAEYDRLTRIETAAAARPAQPALSRLHR